MRAGHQPDHQGEPHARKATRAGQRISPSARSQLVATAVCWRLAERVLRAMLGGNQPMCNRPKHLAHAVAVATAAGRAVGGRRLAAADGPRVEHLLPPLGHLIGIRVGVRVRVEARIRVYVRLEVGIFSRSATLARRSASDALWPAMVWRASASSLCSPSRMCWPRFIDCARGERGGRVALRMWREDGVEQVRRGEVRRRWEARREEAR